MEKFEIEVQTRINVKKNSLDGKKFCRNEIHFKLKICFSRKLRYQVSQFCRLGSVVRNSDMSVRRTLTKILKIFLLILENETYAGAMFLIRSIKGWKNQRKNKLVPMDDLSKWCWKINPPWLSLLISNQPSAKTFLFSFSHNYDSHELIIINRGNHSPKVPNGGSLYHGFGWWVIHFGPGIPSHYRLPVVWNFIR